MYAIRSYYARNCARNPFIMENSMWQIENGWLTGVRHCVSPHCNPRPAGGDISLLVVHGISLPPDQFGGPWIDDLFLGRLDPAVHPYFAQIARLA